MFTLVAVDTHGYHETPLYDNDGALDLDRCTTIAIHWKPAYLDLFEDSKFVVPFLFKSLFHANKWYR
jgi:hypothetical protein